MLGQYLPLLFLFALSALFAAGSCAVSGILSPRHPTVPKLSPYECGIVPDSDTPERFPVRFFLVAMTFIVFDVEIILFYPYAVARGGLGVFGLVVVLVFTFAVFESFVYLIGAGALEWGPASKSQRRVRLSDISGVRSSDSGVRSSGSAALPLVSAHRTAKTTVRRVGLEGRGVSDHNVGDHTASDHNVNDYNVSDDNTNDTDVRSADGGRSAGDV